MGTEPKKRRLTEVALNPGQVDLIDKRVFERSIVERRAADDPLRRRAVMFLDVLHRLF